MAELYLDGLPVVFTGAVGVAVPPNASMVSCWRLMAIAASNAPSIFAAWSGVIALRFFASDIFQSHCVGVLILQDISS
jgi:hypothetical protein